MVLADTEVVGLRVARRSRCCCLPPIPLPSVVAAARHRARHRMSVGAVMAVLAMVLAQAEPCRSNKPTAGAAARHTAPCGVGLNSVPKSDVFRVLGPTHAPRNALLTAPRGPVEPVSCLTTTCRARPRRALHCAVLRGRAAVSGPTWTERCEAACLPVHPSVFASRPRPPWMSCSSGFAGLRDCLAHLTAIFVIR